MRLHIIARGKIGRAQRQYRVAEQRYHAQARIGGAAIENAQVDLA